MRIPTMIRSRPFGHHPRSLCVKSLFLSQLRCFVGCFFFPFLSGVNKKPHHFISSALSGSCITTCFLSEICFYCYALQINTADMFNWMTRFQSRLLSTKCPFFIFREEKKKKKVPMVRSFWGQKSCSDVIVQVFKSCVFCHKCIQP